MTADAGAFWFLLVGVLLVALAVLGRLLDRLPLSPAMIYLLVGIALGPAGVDALELHPLRHPVLIRTITEIALLIALFTVGIKLRVPVGDWRWSVPLRLATLSMVITVGGIVAAGYWLAGMSVGLALILGATLAPTDPVLASDVQLRSPEDRDTLRFALTGEGGLNDGSAFPFLLLGLGLLGLHEIGAGAWRWVAVDLLWATAGGLGVGFAVGDLVARGVRWLRARRDDTVVLDEFLLLGVIAVSYGAAVACGALGFLAVFAAGIALRRADDIHAGSRDAAAEAPLTPSMLNVNEQLERIVEVAIVLLVGVMISTGYASAQGLWLAALLFFVIRPAAVWIGVLGEPAARSPRRLLGWFGIRGIGSVYYAVYAASRGLPQSAAVELLSCAFTVIAASILVHGVSATPLMDWYHRRRGGERIAARQVSDKR